MGQLLYIAAPSVFVFVFVSVFVSVSSVRRLFDVALFGVSLGLLAVTVAVPFLAFTLGITVRFAFGLSCKLRGNKIQKTNT